MRDFESSSMDAESDSEIAVRFAKSRSPRHLLTEEADGLTGDVFMPLVAGDEFEEEEGTCNTNINFGC